MMMRLTLRTRAKSRSALATFASALSVTTSAPSDSASRSASAMASLAASGKLAEAGVTTLTAIQATRALSDARFAVRTKAVAAGNSLMQTRMRSWVGHGPVIAWLFMCAVICASTRSAATRSASSRRAVRLPLEKKFWMARAIWSAT